MIDAEYIKGRIAELEQAKATKSQEINQINGALLEFQLMLEKIDAPTVNIVQLPADTVPDLKFEKEG